MIIKKVNIDTLDNLSSFAKDISDKISSPCVILLNGPLGAGKTTFTKFLIGKIFGHHVDVISPTFNVLQIYEENNILIYHYDFYRLKNEMELINLDLDYALVNAITIIEWPDIAQNFINTFIESNRQINLQIFFEKNKRFIKQI